MAEFEAFPKIPRLNRDITVTEKIDGTNAAIIIEEVDPTPHGASPISGGFMLVDSVPGGRRTFIVQAQSRKRLIYPNSEENKGADNYGFAGWVEENKEELIRLLGPGRHFGEWWGQSIARNYGLDHRRFSLFNVARYDHIQPPVGTNQPQVHLVPVLYSGPFRQEAIDGCIRNLREGGSKAAPGFMRPEGVIVYHTAAGQLFKVTCEDDEKPKEVVARETAKVAANGGGKVDFA